MKRLFILTLMLAGCEHPTTESDFSVQDTMQEFTAYQSATTLSVERAGHTATLLPSGKILIAGGINASGPLGSLEVYDPVADSIVTLNTVIVPRFNHSATLLESGDVLLVGGITTGSVSTNSVQVVNPVTDQIYSLSMSVARTSHTATKLKDGRVMIAGGENAGGPISSTEIFSGGAISSGPAMGYTRASHSANVLPDGDVLFTMGIGTGMGNAEIYDYQSGAFGSAIGVWTARLLHKAAETHGGILINGGFDGTNTIFKPEFFNYHTRTFVQLPNSLPVRDAHRSVTLSDGRVFMLGGAKVGVALETTGVYDPMTLSLAPAYDLSFARQDHSATVLADDRIVIIGGGGDAGASIWFDTIEIIDFPSLEID